jgi:hypothetical protein
MNVFFLQKETCKPQNKNMTSETSSTSQPPEKNSTPFKVSWNEIKIRIKEVLSFLPAYLKNPLEGIKHVPSWDWWTVIILEILLGAICGALSGVVSRHILAIFGGLIVEPITSLLVSVVVSGIMYYACLFLLKTELDFKRVFIVVVLAKLPAEILSVISPVAKPITLLGIVATTVLLIVGFTENFMLDKKKVSQIVGTLAGVLILFWFYSLVTEISSTRIKVQDYTPESLDQIHKELSEGENQ